MTVATNNDVSISESRNSDGNNEKIEKASYHSFEHYNGDIVAKIFEDESNSTNFSEILNY